MSQEIETIFRCNGVEYSFDARDADDAEKFEKALENMAETEKTLPKEGRLSTIYRAHCETIKQFFDDIFGEGAGIAICTEKSNVTVHYDAYDELLKLVRSQRNDVTRATNKYSAHRRKKKHNNKQKK